MIRQGTKERGINCKRSSSDKLQTTALISALRQVKRIYLVSLRQNSRNFDTARTIESELEKMSIPKFAIDTHWMRFDQLDNFKGGSGVYTLCWRFTDNSSDRWTARINSFKSRAANSDVSAMWTFSHALPILIEAKGWVKERTGLTVALSSSDVSISLSKPLPRLGENASNICGIRWLPNLLAKTAHRSLHFIHDGSARDNEVSGKYTAAPVTGLDRIIVLDDIVTRGSTLREISRAIRAATATVEVVPIALAKSERQSYATAHGHAISNDHVPVLWADLWDKHAEAKK